MGKMQGGPIETVRFGRYEVLRPIGEGGMARVYLCLQRGAGRFQKRLVLKVLHPKFAGNEEAYQMFLEEARVMARLHHPNIVEVFEVDTVDGIPYIAIEYVNGPTLGRLYRHVGRPSPQNIGYFVAVLRQVCEGLHYAHTLVVDGRPAGVIHRDVSSQNIVIDAASGVAKLIDFGIAKAIDADKETQMGILKGRLHYIAPEVLAGARPDARADVYSVGVLLYRILSGRAPFRPHELFGGDQPPPSLAYPPGISEIVEKATRNSRELRYATAAELGSDLQRVVDHLGTNPAQLAPFVARVFPRGEEDWRRPEVDRAATHRSLIVLASEAPPAPPVAPRPLPLTASTMTLLGWVAVGAMLLATAAVLLAAVAALIELLIS